MYFSLEDAISCPPAFISISRAGNAVNNTQPETSKDDNSPEQKKEDVLRGWVERPSIHVFMNSVLSLCLKRKQQQENLQQQLREQEEKEKEEQVQHLKQQIQQQKQQQFQLGKNLFTSSPNSPSNDSLQLQGLAKETTTQTQNVGDIHSQESCVQRKPKVKKVMKGGVLVSIPCTRQPPGAKAVENNGEKHSLPFSNFKDKANDSSGGNILDDILARAKDDQRAISVQNAGSKTHKKISKSSESAVKICSKSSSIINPLIKEKVNDPGSRKLPGTDEMSKPCILEQYDPKIIDEISTEFDATDKQETKSLNGINEEENAGSLSKSINAEALKVNLSKDKETDGGSKVKNKIAPNKKRLVRLSRNLNRMSKGKPAELKISSTKPTGDQNVHSSSKSFLSVLQAKKREKEVMIGQETDVIGRTCDVPHKSDGSIGTGKLVISTKSDDESNLSFKKSKRRSMSKDSLTSTESSDDSDVESSFNRIRALQFDNDVFINNVETCEDQSSTKEVPWLPDVNEKSLKEIQGMILDERKTKGNQIANVKQQNMESNVTSEEYKVATAQIPSRNTSDDCTMTQTKGLNDSMHPNELMVVQAQNPEATLTEDKNELKENERKKKELLNEIPDSINTKRKRLIRMPFKTTTPVETDHTNLDDTNIQTKRKRYCKNIDSVEPQVENNKSLVTRSMAHQINSDKAPINKTKTQHSSQATLMCLPKNEDKMAKLEEIPSLLSMISDEVLDVTVEENVIKRNYKRKSSGKKRNKPTAWFLRKQKKLQELKNDSKPSQYVQPAVCSFFLNGTCAQGNMCKFRHEKIKELCIYYTGHNGCYKWNDGMCPKMHDEFPCRFFHKKKFCLNEGHCKFSHEPLTKEMANILDNYLLTLQERYKNEGDQQSLESNGSVTEKSENKINEIETSSVDKNGRSLSTASVTVSSQSIVKPLPDKNKLKHPVPPEVSSKPADSPKVRRLCSLSSYKPQILPSLVSSMKSLERSSSHELPRKCNPGDSPQTKADEPMFHFLPGIFKER